MSVACATLALPTNQGEKMTNFADWEDTHFDVVPDFDDRENDGWSERDDFHALLAYRADLVAAGSWDDVSDDWRYRDACDYPPF
jgi:hypothetical protein